MSAGYGRGSRYREVAVVRRIDHEGRVLQVDDLRLRRPLPGTFRHNVEAGDRLDHLAERYYGDPGRWWPIADANPDFTSPLALLGHDPVTTVRLVLARGADARPLGELLAALRSHAGVEDVRYGADDPESVTVRFNRATTGADALVALLARLHVGTGTPEVLGRVGRPLVVPPEVTG